MTCWQPGYHRNEQAFDRIHLPHNSRFCPPFCFLKPKCLASSGCHEGSAGTVEVGHVGVGLSTGEHARSTEECKQRFNFFWMPTNQWQRVYHFEILALLMPVWVWKGFHFGIIYFLSTTTTDGICEQTMNFLLLVPLFSRLVTCHCCIGCFIYVMARECLTQNVSGQFPRTT